MDKTFGAISRLLAGHMLGHAFELMRPWVVELLKVTGDATPSNRLQSLQQNYQYVVEYFMNDEDNMLREEVTESLIREAFMLLDEVYLEKRLRESKSYEFLQMLKLQAEAVGPRVESEDDLNGPPQVFRFFWLCKRLEDFDLDVLDEYIHNPEMEEEAQLGLSGLTLNLLRCFSETGLLFLITICRGKHAMTLTERAWVGLILVMMHYDTRLRYFPNVMNAFLDLIATDEGSAFALHAFSALIRTSGVKWATASFSDLQGELTRLVSENLPTKQNKHNLISLSLEDLDDFSKELSEELDSIIEERREAISRLRERHLDANYAIYKNLYNTAFFSDPFHWWLPFDTDYLKEKELDVAGSLEAYFPDDICDSDRFALITALAMLDNNNGGLPEGLVPNINGEEEMRLVCNSYMQQAYRFFTLNPWNISNIFDEVDSLPNSNLLKLLRPSAQDKLRVANQFLTCHAYQTALELYQDNALSMESAETWRNYGLCLQKIKAYEDAVVAYDRSLEVKISEWALRQKVWCLMKLTRYDEALQALDQLLELQPEDTSYLFEKGKCLEHMELYFEALDIYYKLDMLHPGNMQVMRAIAWCAFISGDTEQAEQYYHKLMKSENRQMIDFLNCGHFLFVQGQRAEAYRHYVQALTLSDSLKSFLTIFRPDRRMLLEKGVPTSDIYLMEDQLILARPR